jgi:hypothetical protein
MRATSGRRLRRATWREQGRTKEETATRTVCLLARRRLEEESADVLPVRQ